MVDAIVKAYELIRVGCDFILNAIYIFLYLFYFKGFFGVYTLYHVLFDFS